jgi:hypothetical protein
MDNADPGWRCLHDYPTFQERVICSAYPTLQSRLFPQTYGKPTLHDGSRSVTRLAKGAHVQKFLAAISSLYATDRCSLYSLLDDRVYNFVHFP